MQVQQKKYQNLLENKNHLTVVSQAHNTIESLENQTQENFTVEGSPSQFYMQRMGQVLIPSNGRGRYDLNLYNTQENLTFPGKQKRFKTEQETQESFIIMSKKKQKNIIQVPTFFRLMPKTKKYDFKPEQNESLIYHKKEKPELELKTENNFIIERKKRFENLIENISDIKIKADGKFFYNKPTLKKKSSLEVEYLVIKAPLKIQKANKFILEHLPKKTRYDNDISQENKFDIYYNMMKPKSFPLDETNISDNTNFIIPHKPKNSSFHGISIENQSNINLIKENKENPCAKYSIENIPYVEIQEWPGKRYCSADVEQINYEGNLEPDYCLEIDPEEEIFIPSVYDMLLIQNFWDNLEIKSFRICLRPLGYNSNKNLNNDILNENNKENISENKESLLDKDKEKEEKKEVDKNLSIDNNNNIIAKDSSRRDSKILKLNLKELLVKKNS